MWKEACDDNKTLNITVKAIIIIAYITRFDWLRET